MRAREENKALQTTEELCQLVLPINEENYSIFSNYGPNSGASSRGPVRYDLTLWKIARLEQIVPNNRRIVELMDINWKLIPDEFVDGVRKFKLHAFAFEKHCADPCFDYSAHQYPSQFYNFLNRHA